MKRQTIKCITCLNFKPIEEFNEEHIFPSAIGGAMTLHNVCKKCNTNLGRIVDQPFLAHQLVAYYRNRFNIARDDNRRKGDVPNPLKGTITDSKGLKHIIKFKDNVPQSEVIETLKFETDESGRLIGKVTIPKEKLEDLDAIIKKLAKRQGYALIDYTIIKEEIHPRESLSIDVDSPNNVFILGCMKIAYESVSHLFPFYLEDEISGWLRDALFTKNINEEFKQMLDGNNGVLMDRYEQIFNKIQGLQPIHHAVLIENIEGIGLVCCVRIFNWFYPIIMSKEMNLVPSGQFIFLYNDAIQRQHASNIQQAFPTTNISVDMNSVSELSQNEIRNQGEEIFKNENGVINVFGVNNEVIYETPVALCIDTLNKYGRGFSWLERNFNIDVAQKGYKLKLKNGECIKLLSVTTERQIILQRLFS